MSWRISPNRLAGTREERNMNALDILKKDHEKVKELFSEYDTLSGDGAKKGEIAQTVLRELELHSKVEEDIFYPALRARSGKDGKELVKHSVSEHREIDDLIAELRDADPSDPDFDDKFQELMEDVEEHIDEEETELFPKAQILGKELENIGKQIQEEKDSALM
jgi:hemerythrin superfamily protein